MYFFLPNEIKCIIWKYSESITQVLTAITCETNKITSIPDTTHFIFIAIRGIFFKVVFNLYKTLNIYYILTLNKIFNKQTEINMIINANCPLFLNDITSVYTAAKVF